MGCYASIPKTSSDINTISNRDNHLKQQKNTTYQIGDRVVCKVSSKPLYGTISAIDSRKNRIEVTFDILRQRGYFQMGTPFQDKANEHKFIEKPQSQQQRSVSLSESLSSENISYINKVQDIKESNTQPGKAVITRGDERPETRNSESMSRSEGSSDQINQADTPVRQISTTNNHSRTQTSSLSHPQTQRKRRRKRRRRRRRAEVTGRELEEMMRLDAEMQRERETRKPPPKAYAKILKSPSRPHPRLIVETLPASDYEPQEVGLDGKTLLIDPVYIKGRNTVGDNYPTALLGPDRAYYYHARGGWQEYISWIEAMAETQRNTIRDTRRAELFESLHPAHRNSPSPSPSYYSDDDY